MFHWEHNLQVGLIRLSELTKLLTIRRVNDSSIRSFLHPANSVQYAEISSAVFLQNWNAVRLEASKQI